MLCCPFAQRLVALVRQRCRPPSCPHPPGSRSARPRAPLHQLVPQHWGTLPVSVAEMLPPWEEKLKRPHHGPPPCTSILSVSCISQGWWDGSGCSLQTEHQHVLVSVLKEIWREHKLHAEQPTKSALLLGFSMALHPNVPFQAGRTRCQECARTPTWGICRIRHAGCQEPKLVGEYYQPLVQENQLCAQR